MLKMIRGSIRNKIMTIPIALIVLVSALSVFYFPQNKEAELKRTLAEEIEIAADLLAYGFGVALEAGDFAAMTQAYEAIKGKNQISYVMIYGEDLELINAYNPKELSIDSVRKSFSTEIAISKNFIEKATTIKTAKATYGTVVVGISLAPLKALVRKIIWMTLLTSLFFLFLFIGITVIVVRRILNPINSVVRSVTALGEGDLTSSCNVTSTDETASIARALNLTIESIATMVQRIKQFSTTVAKESVQFNETADTIAENTEIVSQKTSQSANRATEAKETLSGISAATDELSSSINTVASAIEQMNASLNEVARNCQTEFRVANEATGQADDALKRMDRLNDTTSKVAKILDVITNIAEQTNLLALNATIEAASAGDAGKGFAVVANEVKELAKQTGNAVDEIQSLINEMSESSGGAVKAVSQIAKVIDEINNISQTIVSAVEEQSVTINEISRNMAASNNSAKSIADKVTSSATGIANITDLIIDVDNNAHETANKVSGIRTSTEALAKVAHELNETVEHFRLN